MSERSPRFSKEEFARRGRELYEHEIMPRVEPKDDGNVVAIDIVTGAYEIAEDSMAAGRKLRARVPDAQTWFERIGQRTLYRFGPHVVGPVA